MQVIDFADSRASDCGSWAKTGELRESLQSLIGYYNENADRRRYAEYLRLGYGIGSGAVESATTDSIAQPQIFGVAPAVGILVVVAYERLQALAQFPSLSPTSTI